ncbi:hypothetical protein N1496_04575 [Streptococcus didelphis]|uniref:Uncharacterized protein n=1 Tax=Streptococcus didelphis TaxID=102886 RepID=A0ABY9LIR7_9STRE|nr:hypothetical protein [Streptococcus didelphis]WMB28737.1 hypothetical protein N1496_04575 [Streptococcus didelphis]
MLKEDILKQIIMISRESFLVFLSTYNKKLDNSLEALKIIAKEKR